MDDVTLFVLWAALIVAWALIPMFVVQYRVVVVPKRYEEIKKRFLRKPGTSGASAALHYARLLSPDAEEAGAERVLKDQFWYFHSWKRYAIPLVVVTLLSGLMLLVSGLWLHHRLTAAADAAPTLLNRMDTTFVMALWGAFVWSVYEIWSRRKSGDLTPVEVLDVALRFVVAIPIGYAFSLLVFETVPQLAAFVASAFPLRDVRQLMRKQALQKLGESRQSGAATTTAVTKGYLGDILSGIGNDTIVRLEELNVETYLDLAYADPVRLMVKTGVPIQLVLAWVDQALLAVYAAPLKSTFDRLGMPCALDAREFYLRHWFLSTGAENPGWRNEPAIKELADKLELPIENLGQLLRSVCDDPHVRFLSAAWYVPGAATGSPAVPPAKPAAPPLPPPAGPGPVP